MELIQLRKDGNKRAKLDGYMLRVTSQEAMSLIISLAHQIEDKNPNGNRREYAGKGIDYFSISVHDEA
jgi:hypothetical protein